MKRIAFDLQLAITHATAGNSREHPMARHRRVKGQHEATAWAWVGAGLRRVPRAKLLPCTVTFTRVGPTRLDDDNNVSGLKAVRDQIAIELGVNDGGHQVRWLYDQAKGGVREYLVRVVIEPIAKVST